MVMVVYYQRKKVSNIFFIEIESRRDSCSALEIHGVMATAFITHI
jgi:hypothetical protein